MAALLDIRNLHVRIPVGFGHVHAVRGVNLSVEAGQTLCVVGESGSGKSMSALSVMNLLPPRAMRDADRILFDGVDIAQLGPRQMAELRGNRIGMVFQEPMTSLNPAYTVGNQLMEVHRRHRGSSRSAAWARAAELLELVGISNPEMRLRQYPHQLSGGLRQRVMIAMALMCEPGLLIADEPTSALDVTIQVQILRLLRDLQRRLGIAVVLITHDLGVVARVADTVAIMYAGQVVETGSARAVFASPRHPYTNGLLRSMPKPGNGRGEPLQAIPGTVPSLLETIPGCAFAERCARADEACRVGPIATTIEERHSFSCNHPADIRAREEV
ncbi:ATP-binding cassette domain-containing protein [Nitratireductor sp. CAU 1489]|uniref:ATP-binding cassette domain-containing protein n=1 Tax=Nitratireductor arenosus TaxID=2682096 RepID=A0A844QGS2_9HYPH|nr:ABC transporter ATP-binding protein [Nitratireductor arenosus]MVA96969.1 ATP-binding cassette domain-containing protein [Nitratireductor arenosus]